MACETKTWWVLHLLLLVACYMQNYVHGELTHVPCIFIFGDSLSDSGNNNNLPTTAKPNYKPYGIDFPKGPTGRFTNGRTTIDIIGQQLGFKKFIPPFANIIGSDILKGVNYASGAAGIREETGKHNLGANIALGVQIKNHKTIISKIAAKLGGLPQAKQYLNKCLYYVNIGSNDYINNYYQPQHYSTSHIYNSEQYAQVLINQLSLYIEALHNVGARKLVLVGLGQIGCTPHAIATNGINGLCAQKQNNDALIFSHKLRSLVNKFNIQHLDSKSIFINSTAGTLDSSLDDTILMGEGSWDNIWTIKSLLRGFELVSGLKINFVKSKLIGLNIEARFLEASATFLSCLSEVVPFKFLGIPVGSNPRRRTTWKPVVDAMSKRLNLWRGRHLSYGGRITLINSVLASLPLYFFSFFKAPTCVIKQLVKIQRNFLWGGGLEEKRLCWVKWDQICLPKEQGGLGVKNLDIFNKALLAKWKWRFLTENEAVWADLLRFRYGHLPTLLLAGNVSSNSVKSSLWWRDIIGSDWVPNENWFMSNVSCCVGNGKNIGFWRFKWYGDQPFCLLFPDLFAKEAFKEAKIAERMQGDVSNRVWLWDWMEDLSASELQQVEELEELLYGLSLNPDIDDRWRWKSGAMGLFSVRSCYSLLLDSRTVIEVDANILAAIKLLWRIDAPSKALIFGWRFLLDRLPTRSALHHRGVLHSSHDLYCVFCSLSTEDSGHLFLSCSFSKGVWAAIFNWVGKAAISDVGGWEHFLLFGELVNVKKDGGKVSRLIWLVTMWSIWKHRNNVIFNGGIPDTTNLVNEIKTTSWLWFSNRHGRNSSPFFLHWCLDPLGCINNTF